MAKVTVMPVSSKGESASWTERQSQARKRWEQWRRLDSRFTDAPEWEMMSLEELCSRELYEGFAGKSTSSKMGRCTGSYAPLPL